MLNQFHETFEKPGFVLQYRVRGNVKIFRGAMTALDPDGWLVPLNPAPGPALRFVGVASESVDATGKPNGVATLLIKKQGTMRYRPASGFTPVQADLGKEVYAHADGSVGIAAPATGQAIKVGFIVALEAGMVRICINGYVR